LGWIKTVCWLFNIISTQKHGRINTNSQNRTLFYPIFHFSANSRQAVDDPEKETFGRFRKTILKLETINARTLLFFFQPIHKPIIIRNILFKINHLKFKNMILIF
jgi:hypothetical protein